MKIKNEKGEDIEVFTEAEVAEKVKTTSEAAATKAVEEFKVANPDKTAELDAAKKSVTDLEEKLKVAEAGTDDEQIKRLRDERDAAKKLTTDLQASFDKKLEDFRKEFAGNTETEMLDKLSKGDAEMRKKIKFEFDSYRANATTKKDVEDRMLKAYQLATGNKPEPAILDNITGGGDRGTGVPGGGNQKKEVTPNEGAIGKVLGITDKDREATEVYKKTHKS